MSKREPRPLTDGERALWAQATRALKPLQARAAKEAPARPPRPAAQAPRRPAAAEDGTNAAPLPRLDRRLKQRLARGQIAIDARIDLHGLTQSEAFAQLTAFLRSARRSGARVVLVITGKGEMPGLDGQERGVLRRQVPLWLHAAGLREGVIGFEPAGAAHGGGGALYVHLRRGAR